MNKTVKTLLAGVLLGALLGAWGMRLYFDRTLGSWNPSERFLAKLTQDLRMTPDQQVKVAGILQSQKDRMEILRRQWRFQVFTLDREGEDAIGRVLNDTQTDAFMAQHDQIHGQMDRYLWDMESGPTALALGPVKR
jgi:hypothetical protein